MTTFNAFSDYPPPEIDPVIRRRRRVTTLLLWCLVAVVAVLATYGGFRVRHAFFDATVPIHFQSDNTRNWAWGWYTFYNMHDRGRSFLDTYDDVGIQSRNARIWIDYAPARLAVVTAWAAWNYRTIPYQGFRSDRDFYTFYIHFSTIFELIGAAGGFMLTRQVLRDAGASEIRSFVLPLIAALLLVFNPAAIISTHGWPSGDYWVVPPFLWALYLARIGRWFAAGTILAIGVLFKGQIFFVLPMFVLWPLFQLRWREPLYLLAGFLATFGLLTAGWTLTTVDAAAVRHISWPALLLTLLPIVAFLAAMIVRWRKTRTVLDHVPRRLAAVVCFGLAGTAALSSMKLFGTSYAWFDASYVFGTDHWPKMIMGLTSNVPGILAYRYGWDMNHGPSQTVFTIGQTAVTMKTLMFSIYAVLLVLSCVGIAIQDARRSTRFLVAVVTPWLLFFTFPCQIHERYLLFAACTACICIGHSVGTALLGILISVLSFNMTLHVMLRNAGGAPKWNRLLHEQYPDWFAADTRFSYDMLRLINGTFPDIGWAVLLLAMIFLYLTLAPGRRGLIPGSVAASSEPAGFDVMPIPSTPQPSIRTEVNDPIPLVEPNEPQFRQEPN
jgi:hypothetical protein